MSRITFSVILVALVAAILIPAASAAENARPLNVVVVLVDDLGWIDLTCQGSKFYETPNIDRLAADGMRFTNGYAACAVCSPTRAALQTGRYPARLGVTDWIRAKFQGGIIGPDGKNPTGFTGGKPPCPRNALFMELDERTIAEILKPAGYQSCYIGKWHLGQAAHFPEKQGYDENHGGCDLGQPPNYFDPYESRRQFYEIPNLPPRKEGEYLTDREADEAQKFIMANKDKPFFLQLAHYAVHTPIQAKPDVRAKYEAKEKTTKQKNATYAAMVESVDDAMGTLLATLEKAGIADRTVVIFTSDNGGLLGPTNNEPLRQGKGWHYEGGIRVPYIVRWPGVVQPGTTCDVPISTVDIFPTIVEMAGLELPADREIDGVSLVPLLKGGDSLDRDAIFWHFPHRRCPGSPYSIIRQGDWKLIRHYADGSFELFNLADDMSETKDLAAERPDLVEKLDQRLTEHLKSVGAKMPIIEPKE